MGVFSLGCNRLAILVAAFCLPLTIFATPAVSAPVVVDVRARHLIPYLADAVPGWFQAVMVLRDEAGKEVAFVDDYRFEPDPVLFYEVPEGGVYELTIRDSIYRGREDFVYRIALGEIPLVTGIFPLGGRTGDSTTVALTGWNLPETTLTVDARGDAP